MATTTDGRAPRVPPSPNSMAARFAASLPDIEWQNLIVNSVTGALEVAGCAAERLRSLLDSTIDELGETIEGFSLPVGEKRRLYNLWLILTVAGEKFSELHKVINAACDRAYIDQRGEA